MSDHESATPMDRRAVLSAGMLGAGMFGAAALAGRASAGPIDPPAGPIGPSGPSLSDVDVVVRGTRPTLLQKNGIGGYTITQPGSYILGESLIGFSNISSISVSAPNVTLDLNGHTVENIGFFSGGATVGTCINTSGSSNNLAVVNGVLRYYSRGINMLGTGLQVDRCRFELIEGGDTAGAYAIRADNGRATVTRCRFTGLGRRAMSLGSYNRIADCEIINPSDIGVIAGSRTVVERCLFQMDSPGPAIQLGLQSRVSGVVVDGPCRLAATLGDNSIIENSQSYETTDLGFFAGSNSRIEGCVVATVSGGPGIQTGVNCIIRNNNVRGCAGYGIDGGAQNVIEHNAVNANGSGIYVRDTSACRNNLVDFHLLGNGIRAQSQCFVEDNSITRSGTAIDCGGTGTVFRRNNISGFATLIANAAGNAFAVLNIGFINNNSNPHVNIIP